MQNKVVALITAAGSGKRLGLGKNKVFFEYKNKFVLEYTLEVFQNSTVIDSILVVLNSSDKKLYEKRLLHNFSKIMYIEEGGDTRQKSVANGLFYLKNKSFSSVVIHDGARPFLNSALLNQLVKNVDKKQGAVLGIKVRDTLKLVRNKRIQKTVSRAQLYQIQTPQCFYLNEIDEAYHQNTKNVTDDAQIFENWGGIVKLVESDRFNFKITYADDLKLFKMLIDQNQGNGYV